jgi:hypothetical protein
MSSHPRIDPLHIPTICFCKIHFNIILIACVSQGISSPVVVRPVLLYISHVRSSLFWDYTQHRLVVSYGRFGTTYRSSSVLHISPVIFLLVISYILSSPPPGAHIFSSLIFLFFSIYSLKGPAADATDTPQPWMLIVQPYEEDDKVFFCFFI